MGKRNPLVAFLCGLLGRKETPPANPDDSAQKQEDTSEPSADRCGDAAAANSAETTDDPPKGISKGEEAADVERQPPLPPPPAGLDYARTASLQHKRSHSFKSKLASSMSMKLPGHVKQLPGNVKQLPGNVNGAVGKQLTKLEEKAAEIRDKKFKQDDSLWKKTIILGERNKAPPDEDQDSAFHDEKGDRIPTYHQRSQSSISSTFSMPDTSDHQQLPKD